VVGVELAQAVEVVGALLPCRQQVEVEVSARRDGAVVVDDEGEAVGHAVPIEGVHHLRPRKRSIAGRSTQNFIPVWPTLDLYHPQQVAFLVRRVSRWTAGDTPN
jgi:hypothetical protein